MSAQPQVVEAPKPLRLDLGCGRNKREGFVGVDVHQFDGVDRVVNLAERCPLCKGEDYGVGKKCNECRGSWSYRPWPWEDASVEEAHSSHFVEHLTGQERIFFFNELYRVLKKGAQAQIITPDWSHACAYGDPTHQWPPMSGWYTLYLNKAWREQNAPHVPYTCDFDWAAGGTWDEWLNVRNMETRMFAMQRYINSTRDLCVTLTKRA
jgi:hypothetical protein